MENYIYKPVRFYVTAFFFTWLFWIPAAFVKEELALALMFFGLIAPSVIAIITVFTSGSDALKKDFKRKLFRFYRLKPLSILSAVLVFVLIIVGSILLSLIWGGTVSQFAFTEDFSFSIGGFSAMLTILLASVIEEIGWRGYGEDSVGAYHTWFTESIIFGLVWAAWHLPLFWISGTYHYGLRELGIGYMLNFLISVVPLGFLTTWVYLENNRSMLACIMFHLFVNTMQEKIAMTPETKCIETLVVTLATILVVMMNREMFFEKTHIGRLLEN